VRVTGGEILFSRSTGPDTGDTTRVLLAGVRLGLLPASPDAVTGGVADARPRVLAREVRLGCCALAVVLGVLAVVPPLYGLAQRYAFAETLQFSVFAIAVPALVALGAPWSYLGLAAHRGPSSGPEAENSFDRLAYGRRRHPELVRSAGFLLLFMGSAVAWRTPAAVDAIARNAWLILPESVVLVTVGVAFWLELVESPPLRPRSTRPVRAGLAAVAMWTVWTVAYLVAFSSASWYPAFNRSVGHGLSAAADQQFSTLVLWSVAAVAFTPVVFWNLLQWLRSEEDPDVELHRLVKEERRHALAPTNPRNANDDRTSGR